MYSNTTRDHHDFVTHAGSVHHNQKMSLDTCARRGVSSSVYLRGWVTEPHLPRTPLLNHVFSDVILTKGDILGYATRTYAGTVFGYPVIRRDVIPNMVHSLSETHGSHKDLGIFVSLCAYRDAVRDFEDQVNADLSRKNIENRARLILDICEKDAAVQQVYGLTRPYSPHFDRHVLDRQLVEAYDDAQQARAEYDSYRNLHLQTGCGFLLADSLSEIHFNEGAHATPNETITTYERNAL